MVVIHCPLSYRQKKKRLEQGMELGVSPHSWVNTPNIRHLALLPNQYYLCWTMPTISKGLTQAYQLQDMAYALACALKEDMTDKDGNIIIRRDEYSKPVDAPALAQLIKAWEACQERIRIHRNKPMPGSLRPIAKPKKVRAVSTKPLESLPTDQLVDSEQSMLKESLCTR